MHPPEVFQSIYSVIETRARLQPDAIAIEAPGREPLSYSVLFRRVNAIIQRLRDAGIRKNDRVAIVLPNGPDLALALLGVTSTCTAAPLNPSYQEREFASYFDDLHVRLLVVDAGSASVSRETAAHRGIPVLELEAGGGADGEHAGPFDALPGGDDIAVVLHTSGSTSRPKIVPLSHRNICISTRDVSNACQLTPRDRCLCIWQQYHIGGLVDLLLVPLASGGTVICANDLRADSIYALLRQYRPTWYQTVPTTLSELLACARRDGTTQVASSLRFIRSVAAELPPRMMAEAEALFGVPVVQTFGMTEAAPLITSNPLPPGRRVPGSVGKSVGPEVGIMDEAGNLLPPGQLGEVVVRGGNVMSGYEASPEINEEAFRHGWFHSGDVGCMDADGYLYLRGRIKEIINRGGEKITPREVDTALLEHPAVEQAVAFSIPHRTLGESVAAAVVLRPGAAATESELKTFVAARLVDFKVPQKIVFVSELPKGPTGKIKRIGMADALKLDAGSEYAAPQTPMEESLARLWADVLGVPRVGRHDNFFDLGGNSLLVVRLIADVEKLLGRPVPMQALQQVYTVEEMARALDSSLAAPGSATAAAPASPSLSDEQYRGMLTVMGSGEFPTATPGSLVKKANPLGTGEPLFWCFNAPRREMLSLVRRLGSQQTIYGMFSGGGVLEDTEPVNKAIADHYVQELLRLRPEGTFIIGGNCRGGGIAAEIAFCLLAAGRDVKQLCILDHFQPRLFSYPGRMLLMYGNRSEFRAYRPFHWGRPGWRRAFTVPPEVCWVSGAHGQFFKDGNVESIAAELTRFLANAPQSLSAGVLLRQYFWLAFHRVPRALALLTRHNAQG